MVDPLRRDAMWREGLTVDGRVRLQQRVTPMLSVSCNDDMPTPTSLMDWASTRTLHGLNVPMPPSRSVAGGPRLALSSYPSPGG
jgi:hypothetical protein